MCKTPRRWFDIAPGIYDLIMMLTFGLKLALQDGNGGITEDKLPLGGTIITQLFRMFSLMAIRPSAPFMGQSWTSFLARTLLDNATVQEISLSAVMQNAWAAFAKNPSCGPGWKALDASGDDLACLGCGGNDGIQIISRSVVDSRCSQYTPLFTASTPYF